MGLKDWIGKITGGSNIKETGKLISGTALVMVGIDRLMAAGTEMELFTSLAIIGVGIVCFLVYDV